MTNIPQIENYIELYKKYGFSPLPVSYRTKKINLPTWELKTSVTNENIQTWIKEGRYEGIALLVGKPSNNLAVLDIDKPKYFTYEFIKEQLTFNEDTIGFLIKTGRGHQLWFNNKLENEINQTKEDYGIDYFVEKHIVVAPPSIHPNGNTYQFIIKPTNFKPTNTNQIFNNFYIHALQNDPDIFLKKIINPMIRQKIMNILQDPKCEGATGHNRRLWLVGFLYTAAQLQEPQINEFIRIHHKWEDYNPKKTEDLVHFLIRYIDRKAQCVDKVSEKGGLE